MKKILFLFAILFSAISFSQNIRFEGVIQDNNKAPLEMANIMAMNTVAKTMDAYAITKNPSCSAGPRALARGRSL